ncbi:UNVERIFIED_CONTAM: hypothetical protein FKN15_049977 [Acipenser sinensis]
MVLQLLTPENSAPSFPAEILFPPGTVPYRHRRPALEPPMAQKVHKFHNLVPEADPNPRQVPPFNQLVFH